MTGKSELFDLSEIAAASDIAVRGRRRFSMVLGGILGAFALVGVALLVGHVSPGGPSPSTFPALLVIFGVLGCVYSVWVIASFRPSPRFLALSDEAARFEDESHRVLYAVNWTSPTTRFRIFDRSGLKDQPPGTGPPRAGYLLEVGSGAVAALTKDAYDAIMREVDVHGLRKTERVVPSRTAARVVMILVTRPRH